MLLNNYQSSSCLIQIDDDGNRYISVNELGRALELVGIKLPAYQVRDLLRQYDVTRDERLDFNEFKKVSRLPTLASLSRLVFVNNFSRSYYCTTRYCRPTTFTGVGAIFPVGVGAEQYFPQKYCSSAGK